MFCVTSSLPNCIHLFNAKNATPKQKSAFPHINLLFSFFPYWSSQCYIHTPGFPPLIMLHILLTSMLSDSSYYWPLANPTDCNSDCIVGRGTPPSFTTVRKAK